jgi:hypothetical protein
MDAASVRELIGALPLAEATCCLLREIMDEQRLTELFDQHRGRSYEKVITFPVMVRMIGDALLQEGGTAYRAFGRAQDDGDLEASMVAAYGKLARMPIGLSMAFLSDRTEPLLAIFPKQARRKSPPCLQGIETIVLDGKAIKNVAKRLLPLRNAGGGLLGGRTLVALHYATGLVLAKHAVADGDANDSRFVPDLMEPKKYPATELLAHYLDRWGIERMFQQVTETFGLQSLIGGTPEATIFQFSFCLLLYNVMQTIRGFVAKNQKRDCESISIENLFRDTRDELTTLSVLLRRGVISVDDLPPHQDNLQWQLNDLLKNQWSDRWIKAKNKNRRPHVHHPGKRTHSSVFRLLHPELKRC